MSAGVTVKSFPVMWSTTDDATCVIRVVKYANDSYYAFEFISNRGTPDDPPKKFDIMKDVGLARATKAAEARFIIRQNTGWKCNDSLFAGIVNNAEQEQIIKFLEKYGPGQSSS